MIKFCSATPPRVEVDSNACGTRQPLSILRVGGRSLPALLKFSKHEIGYYASGNVMSQYWCDSIYVMVKK